MTWIFKREINFLIKDILNFIFFCIVVIVKVKDFIYYELEHMEIELIN